MNNDISPANYEKSQKKVFGWSLPEQDEGTKKGALSTIDYVCLSQIESTLLIDFATDLLGGGRRFYIRNVVDDHSISKTLALHPTSNNCDNWTILR